MNNTKRLWALDTLRGFDMFWIIGGGQLFRQLAETSDWAWTTQISEQLTHAQWEGFHAFDLVFPLFMFISGVAIPFSIIKKKQEGKDRKNLLIKVGRRVVLLIVLGLVYNRFLDFDFQNLRAASVLGQIAISYFFASVIVLYTNAFRQRVLVVLGILIAYTGLQLLVPVPGFGAGVLTQEGSVNGWIDQLFLPGRLYGGTFDPEGILCIVSASAITLLGVLAGEVLMNDKLTQYKKTLILGISGCVLIFLGYVIAQWYPIIKSLWTTTFNLVAGGWALLLLALFYLFVDVLAYRKWTLFFRVIGLNSIFIYLAVRMISFRGTAEFLFGGVGGLVGIYEPALLMVGIISLEWFLLYFLYKKQFFLRV